MSSGRRYGTYIEHGNALIWLLGRIRWSILLQTWPVVVIL